LDNSEPSQLPGIVSQVGIRARDDVGNSGDLFIDTRRLVLRGGGFISNATFASGNSGNSNINATESIDIRGATPAVTRNQYRSGIRTPGEFIITGRGELSPNPIDQLGASSTLPHWITRNDATSHSATPRSQEPQRQTDLQLPNRNEIVEAQGWVKTAEGEIMLVAESPAIAQASATRISCNH
jgi:large exoprotein involved in heme utilization and adhesion